MSKLHARRAYRAAYLAAPAASFAAMIAALGHPTVALAAAVVAAALVICPLVWALKQEVRR
jgi:uncharacterized MnhB-related membrane protein